MTATTPPFGRLDAMQARYRAVAGELAAANYEIRALGRTPWRVERRSKARASLRAIRIVLGRWEDRTFGPEELEPRP